MPIPLTKAKDGGPFSQTALFTRVTYLGTYFGLVGPSSHLVGWQNGVGGISSRSIALIVVFSLKDLRAKSSLGPASVMSGGWRTTADIKSGVILGCEISDGT